MHRMQETELIDSCLRPNMITYAVQVMRAAQPIFLKVSRGSDTGLALLARGTSWRLRGTYPPNSSSDSSVSSLLWRLRRLLWRSLLRESLCRDLRSLQAHVIDFQCTFVTPDSCFACALSAAPLAAIRSRTCARGP